MSKKSWPNSHRNYFIKWVKASWTYSIHFSSHSQRTSSPPIYSPLKKFYQNFSIYMCENIVYPNLFKFYFLRVHRGWAEPALLPEKKKIGTMRVKFNQCKNFSTCAANNFRGGTNVYIRLGEEKHPFFW